MPALTELAVLLRKGFTAQCNMRDHFIIKDGLIIVGRHDVSLVKAIEMAAAGERELDKTDA